MACVDFIFLSFLVLYLADLDFLLLIIPKKKEFSMDYENFKLTVLASIRNYFGNEASVTLDSIIKNNDIRLDGLLIEDSSVNITPTIYLNGYYEEYLAGKPLPSVLDDMIASYQEHLPKQSMDLSFFMDYQKTKPHIIYKLVNYAQNKERLKELPHFKFLDLAIVFCCYLPNVQNTNAAILIQNHHLELWDVTPDSLYTLAFQNTPVLLPYDLSSMEDILKPVFPELLYRCGPESGKEPILYVLSNTEKYFGASVMLYPNILSCFAQLVESDLYILPSSIHEVLLLPQKQCPNASGLNHIIQEVNSCHVSREEILSGHFYYFDRSLDAITQ